MSKRRRDNRTRLNLNPPEPRSVRLLRMAMLAMMLPSVFVILYVGPRCNGVQ